MEFYTRKVVLGDELYFAVYEDEKCAQAMLIHPFASSLT